mmetsp:Transcript_65169/g.175255  ORF Transcript_65169/g.175255 Transcript_65169/m.175255 type:complete len:222 (-) Transcript_65169:1506-2171(-)
MQGPKPTRELNDLRRSIPITKLAAVETHALALALSFTLALALALALSFSLPVALSLPWDLVRKLLESKGHLLPSVAQQLGQLIGSWVLSSEKRNGRALHASSTSSADAVNMRLHRVGALAKTGVAKVVDDNECHTGDVEASCSHIGGHQNRLVFVFLARGHGAKLAEDLFPLPLLLVAVNGLNPPTNGWIRALRVPCKPFCQKIARLLAHREDHGSLARLQ